MTSNQQRPDSMLSVFLILRSRHLVKFPHRKQFMETSVATGCTPKEAFPAEECLQVSYLPFSIAGNGVIVETYVNAAIPQITSRQSLAEREDIHTA